MTKEIIYSNLEENDKITRTIERAKLLLINSNDEILLVNMNNNYQLPGGHLEEKETLEECLIREVKEEIGIEILPKNRKPFLKIRYGIKDYPNVGDNSLHTGNYYFIEEDLMPNMNNTNFTKEEINGNIRLEFIHKDQVIDVLKQSLLVCTKKEVVEDTINAIEYYLDIKERRGKYE